MLIELAMAAWRMSPAEVLALTDEQFNALICRLIERKAREQRATTSKDREISGDEALSELGITVERWPVKNGDQSR